MNRRHRQDLFDATVRLVGIVVGFLVCTAVGRALGARGSLAGIFGAVTIMMLAVGLTIAVASWRDRKERITSVRRNDVF